MTCFNQVKESICDLRKKESKKIKASVSNVGVSQCKFCGINVGKGINAGVETMRTRVKNVDSFSRENLPNKVVKKVLGGSSMSGGNDG